MSIRLTAVVIAKNEEARINACLTNLSWVDEIIVVDSGSTDNTIKESRKHNAVVVETQKNNFSYLRDLGLQHASGTWILYIDADEEVGRSLRDEVIKLIDTYKEGYPTGYFIKRDSYYLGHHWPYQDKMQRLFLKSALSGWQGLLHESPIFIGDTGELTHSLVHRTHRTLEEMLQKTNDWSVIEAKLRYESHHPPVVWWRFLRVMTTGFMRSYIHQEGWKAGTVGWIESIYQAFSMFITYAKLWEMQQKNLDK